MYKIIMTIIPFVIGTISIIKGLIEKDAWFLSLGFGLWIVMNFFEIMFIKEELRGEGTIIVRGKSPDGDSP